MKKHNIRIVGGAYRRTPIVVHDAPGLRPTPDRVRETLFNWLHHLWQGAFEGRRVLDLFAGSGALGFEAASRGVALVQMVESDPKAAEALRALRSRLKANAVRIHCGDALHLLGHSKMAPFDLILLDPPFGEGWLERTVPLLAPLLLPGGLVYMESETPLDSPAGLEALRTGRAGRVHYGLHQFAALQNANDDPAIKS